jgi:hypothetical protein
MRWHTMTDQATSIFFCRAHLGACTCSPQAHTTLTNTHTTENGRRSQQQNNRPAAMHPASLQHCRPAGLAHATCSLHSALTRPLLMIATTAPPPHHHHSTPGSSSDDKDQLVPDGFLMASPAAQATGALQPRADPPWGPPAGGPATSFSTSLGIQTRDYRLFMARPHPGAARGLRPLPRAALEQQVALSNPRRLLHMRCRC